MDLELQKLLYKLFADLPFDFVDGVQDVAFPYGALLQKNIAKALGGK